MSISLLKRLKRISPSVSIIALVAFFFSAFIATFIKIRPGADDTIKTLFGATTFLFGIFLAFSIADSRSRFNKITTALEMNRAAYLGIYQFSGVLGPKVQMKIQKLIDNLLIDTLDYFLTDYKYSSKSFLNLSEYVINLEPETKSEQNAYSSMTKILIGTLNNRKQVEALVRRSMLRFEWAIILILLFIILFCLFSLNDGTLVSIVTTTLLSTATITLVFVLRDFNSLRWKEEYGIWDPLGDLFRELDLLPYYPRAVLNEKRVKLEKGQKVRIVEYPNPYPDMTGKEVKVVEV